MVKTESSFGNIIAMMGAILISLGFAWLIAQNWHQIPAPFKILILVLATGSAFALGTYLRIKDFKGIGQSLLVLGGLLFTLSVFLIAQIYNYNIGSQGNAWLMFLSMIGVLFSSIVFNSRASYFVLLIEFFIWVFMQGFAFFGNIRYDTSSIVLLALFFIISGLLSSLFGLILLILEFRKSELRTKFSKVFISILSSTTIFFLFGLSNIVNSLQGVAWVLLFSIVIVTFLAYYLKSPTSLLLSLLQLITWIIVQYSSFGVKLNTFISPGILAFYFLILGVFMYGLNLLHKVKMKTFSKIYLFWTALYFLAFTYILSFQTMLPLMWPKNAGVSASSIIFLIVMGVIATVTLIWGIVSSLSAKSVGIKEISAVIIIIVILGILIGITSFASSDLGKCNKKNCYNIKNENSCNQLNELNCEWKNNYCQIKSCSFNQDKLSCESYEGADCEWDERWCRPITCRTLSTESSCLSFDKLDCIWENNYCSNPSCFNYNNLEQCENNQDKIDCKMIGNNCQPYDVCNDNNDQYDQCSSDSSCIWRQTTFMSNSDNLPTSVWVIWLIINVAFILIILSIVGYGTYYGFTKLINLAIIVFAIDIITRYIGFVIDLDGYQSLSLIFITGGSILILGGWGLEKWRKNLIIRAQLKK